jgi:hypothetical protein
MVPSNAKVRAKCLIELLALEQPLQISDIGERITKEVPVYKPLLDYGVAHLRGFEPEAVAFEALKAAAGENVSVYPFAVGKLGPATFYAHHIGMLSSVFKRCASAAKYLGKGFIIIPEVQFYRMYEDEPIWADVDMKMRAQGFVLHKIVHQKFMVFPSSQASSHHNRDCSQFLDGAAVYIRNVQDIDALNTHQPKARALAADIVVQSYDLCAYRLKDLKARGAGLGSATRQYYGRLSSDVLADHPVQDPAQEETQVSTFDLDRHLTACAMPHFGPTRLLSLCSSQSRIYQNGSQFDDICAADGNYKVRKDHVLDSSGAGSCQRERRAQLFTQVGPQNGGAIDTQTHQPVHVSAGAGRRGCERDCSPMDRLYLSGHRTGIRRRKGCGRRVDHRVGSDRDQSCGGDQHRRDVCAALGIQADRPIANSGFPWGVAVRGRSRGAGARGLRPFLSAVVDRRHDGERVTANLTPKFTFNLIQRSAVSRILCFAMERE